MRARPFFYQGIVDLWWKGPRIMLRHSARYARGSDIYLKGHNHPKWDTLGGFSGETEKGTVTPGNERVIHL
jgi:hypothetical protein